MSTIKIKKSSIQGRIPSTSDLDYGELAINIADGKLYFKTSSNEIQYFNASFADSSTVTGLIDSDYISNRQAPGLDSADVTNIVISNQNLAFKRFLVSGQFDVVADSSADAIEFAAGNNITLTTTPDDDTITFSTTALNASDVTSLIDSSYVQARQASAGGGIDSAAVSALIDSDYVSARAPSGTNSFGTVAVSGVGSFVADQLNDTVTFVGGTNVTLQADINTDTITINSTGGSGSGGSLDFGTIASPAGFTLDLGAI